MSREEVTALVFNTSDERFIVTRLEENGDIKLRYSTQVNAGVNCEMHFELFPFDSQTCTFLIMSLGGQKSIRKKIFNFSFKSII